MLSLKEQSTAVLRGLDKLDKIGKDGVEKELSQLGIHSDQIGKILQFAEVRGGHAAVLSQLRSLLGENETASEGIERLHTVCEALQAAGVPQERFEIDISIARGLDYYTGIIFETTLLELPKIGKIGRAHV